MATRDVTDGQVCLAYAESLRQRDAGRKPYDYPYEILQRMTGQCEKVCYRAMERANDRGYVEYGVSLRTGWLTPKGKALLEGMKQ